MSTNEALHSAAVKRMVVIERFKAGEARRLLGLLNELDADLAERIQSIDPTSASARRLKALFDDITDLNQTAVAQFRDGLYDTVDSLARTESDNALAEMIDSIPIDFKDRSANLNILRSAIYSRPFAEGGLLKDWVLRFSGNRLHRLKTAIRLGVAEGETIEAIVRRVRGTRSLGFRDGVLDISRRGASAIVRTSVNHVASRARQATFEENGDLVKGVRWVSTLDTRTSNICQLRDGKVYPVDSGPRPPAHIGCRSTVVPVVKSWKELGIDLKEAPPGTRASMDGQVPDNLTYGDWLKRQSRDTVRDVLGKTKAKLFLEGDLEIDRFKLDNGRELTLEEIRDRMPGTFRRAGLPVTEETTAQRKRRERDTRAFFEKQTEGGYGRLLNDAKRAISKDSTTRKTLSNAELATLHAYTTEKGSHSTFRRFNNELRAPNKGTSESVAITTLRRGLGKLPAFRGNVMRRTDLPKSVAADIVPGRRFSDPAFFSTSRGKSEFNGDYEFVVVSRTGREIAGYSRLPHEREVLFLPDTDFLITGIRRLASGRVRVFLKEIEK